MAKLFNIAFLLAFNLILAAADDCKCSEEIKPQELEEVWKFMSTENPILAVIPGELAELVPCRNCLDQSRRKRRIEEQVVHEFRREQAKPIHKRGLWSFGHNARNKCPIGYRKMFWKCLKF